MKNSSLALLLLIILFNVTTGWTADNKKVLYIDSYHTGYAWSDGIEAGIKSTLKGRNITLEVVKMDTKRKKMDKDIKQAVLKVNDKIAKFKPDVVIASDDNASKYVIVPFFKNSKTPFVFCGVNWEANSYGFPLSNVTGMIEVDDFKGLVKLLKQFAKGDRIGFIGDDTRTNRKVVDYAKKIFNFDLITHFSTSFEDWKKGYVDLQSKADLLIFYTYISIKDWNKDEAVAFVNANTKIPTDRKSVV